MSRPWVRVGLVAVAILAVVAIGFAVLRGGGSSAPASLAVGDCIDVPDAAAIATIPKLPCTEPHDGEVFHVFEVSGAGGTTYPADPDWGTMIYPVCDPAFERYTGTAVETRTDIDYVYLVPTEDRWSNGDRRVTCFIQSLDGAPLLRSYREST
ncbi:MAG TPA: septum formation family protein [Candidatus Limnocylindrales bacterium]|nr:septum formation family protein [Candidatus Limnocylindrales bacterium]